MLVLDWRVITVQQNKMTRKQALACFDKQFGILGSGPKWIDFFIETGMLQVEEEKTVEQVVDDKIIKAFAGKIIYGHRDLLVLADKYGLKIVEK